MRFTGAEERSRACVDGNKDLPRSTGGCIRQFENDRELVLEAIRRDGDALWYASPGLRNDRRMADAALHAPGGSINYNFLRVCPLELRDDRAFVLQVVRRDGHNFVYASKALRGDQEILDTALKNCDPEHVGHILENASMELRGDREVVCLAIILQSSSLYSATKELQLDPSIASLAWETVEEGDSDFWKKFDDRRSNDDLYNVYLQEAVEISDELKRSNKLHELKVADPLATIQVAEGWTSMLMEQIWLMRELIASRGTPTEVFGSIEAFAGLQVDLMLATRLLRFFSVLHHMKTGLQAGDYFDKRRWKEFVVDAQDKVDGVDDSSSNDSSSDDSSNDDSSNDDSSSDDSTSDANTGD